MTKKIKTDLLVIGAGAGGLSVAAGAAQLGIKVVFSRVIRWVVTALIMAAFLPKH